MDDDLSNDIPDQPLDDASRNQEQADHTWRGLRVADMLQGERALLAETLCEEQEWMLRELGEGVAVETGHPKMRRINFRHPIRDEHCAFVYVEEKAFFDQERGKHDAAAMMKAVSAIAREPGLKIFYMDNARMSVDDFFSRCPDGSEAVDGFVQGYGQVKYASRMIIPMHPDDHDATLDPEEAQPLAEITDHHIYRRDSVDCASMQIYRQIKEGKVKRFVNADGEPVRNMFFSRICDLDERFSLFGRLFEDDLAAGRARTMVDKMYELENDIDVTAGPAPMASLDDFATLNYINVAPDVADCDTDTKAWRHFEAMRESCRRAQKYIRDEGERIDPVTDYIPLRPHFGWASVCEPVDHSAAKWQMLRDEYGAALILKGAASLDPARDPREVKNYTIQKIDERSSFPLGDDLYGFLNFVTTLDPSITADESSMQAHLRTLDPYQSFLPYRRRGSFGGDTVAGGGRTPVRWDVLDTALQWYVSLHSRTPDAQTIHVEMASHWKARYLHLIGLDGNRLPTVA
jgi:hypothetical protein